jgi:hypothetical protein
VHEIKRGQVLSLEGNEGTVCKSKWHTFELSEKIESGF